MIVVSNTSPIFYLSTIGQLDLLRQLYGEIVIPTAVFNLIQEVKPLLDALIEQVGFWVDEQLYAEVLQAVGESS